MSLNGTDLPSFVMPVPRASSHKLYLTYKYFLDSGWCGGTTVTFFCNVPGAVEVLN